MLQGNAAGKCASQPHRATSAAQPKGCSGSSVPHSRTYAPQKGTFSPKATPFRDKRPPERLFLPKTGPIPGQTPPAPPKKCISSPKPAPFRDKLSKKCISSPKPTPFRDKLPQPHQRNAFPPQKSPQSGTNPALEPELLHMKKAGLRYLNAGRPIYPT